MPVASMYSANGPFPVFGQPIKVSRYKDRRSPRVGCSPARPVGTSRSVLAEGMEKHQRNSGNSKLILAEAHALKSGVKIVDLP